MPYTKEHNIGVFVYGALGHGLLSGTLSEDMVFAANDWRRANVVYQGDAYPTNLAVIKDLQTIRLAMRLDARSVSWRSRGSLPIQRWTWPSSGPTPQCTWPRRWRPRQCPSTNERPRSHR